MIITAQSLGRLSEDVDAKNKFILLDSGLLLYGVVKWHKDLFIAANVNDTVKVIGAGILPEDRKTDIANEQAWGGWKSSGYEVVTPIELRSSIKDAFRE